MLTTPVPVLEALAPVILPGCKYQFATDKTQNKLADRVKSDQPIFFVDDRIPVKYDVAKNGKLDITYTITVLLLLTSQVTDPSPIRWPRVVQMIDAGARLLLALQQHEDIQSVRQIGAEILYNHFDRNADGVGLTYEIVPVDSFEYC